MRRHIIIFAAAAALFCSCGEPQEDPKPQLPATPTGVAVSGSTTTSLSFAWNAVEGATSYVARLEDTSGALVSGGQKTVYSPSASYDGLTEGKSYSFKVRSINADGTSEYSTPLSASTQSKGGTTPVDPDPPTPPTPSDDQSAYYPKFAIPPHEDAIGSALAFPGAEGGGMYVTGGRGGSVYHVTTLADSGSGSLRYGISNAQRPCTIVFDVAGIIELRSSLNISKGDITIAGQTAPGDGICIKNYATQVSADNVIIRFVRFRLGDEGPNAGDSDDAIWGRYRKGIIIDHCSMSWSIDECASFYSNQNMTMQWCLIAESMKNCSKHSKGDHGYGGIWGGKDASFHHNILAHHDSRNPRFDHPHIYQNHKEPAMRGNVDFRNNVVYDWGSNSSYGGEGAWYNMVANYYKPGPSSKDRKYFMDAYGIYSSCSSCGSNINDGYPLLYMADNVHTKYADISAKNTDGIYWHNGSTAKNYGSTASAQYAIVGPAGQACHTTTHSASAALTQTCTYAGASLRRDAVDTRLAKEVADGTGKVIDDIAHVKSLYGAAWPEYKATSAELAAIADTDGDGIPDAWEKEFGLDPKDASDGKAFTLDTKSKRYTNLEMYLHHLVKDIVTGQAENGTYNVIK